MDEIRALKIAGAERRLDDVGRLIHQLGETAPGSLEQANVLERALTEMREALYFVVDVLKIKST